MTVPEMGKLLGLKRQIDTGWYIKMFLNLKRLPERYESILPALKNGTPIRLNIIKLPEKNREKELKSWSYSVKEVADLLSVDDYLVYELLKKNQMETVYYRLLETNTKKESFQNWYKSQSRYRTKEDREKDALLEDATITMPEMAQLLGTTRSAVYTILDNPKYSHFFEFIVIAEKRKGLQKRIFKNSWKVRTGINWIHRMIMKNLRRNKILPWLISGGRNYHKPECEEAMEI